MSAPFRCPPRYSWRRISKATGAASIIAAPIACTSVITSPSTIALPKVLAAVRFHTEHGDEADEQQPAVDLGGRVWLGGRPCKGGPTAPASGG